MGNFIENVNDYIKERKVKVEYLEIRTSWSRSKVYRILKNEQDIKASEMEVLAKALRKSVYYFSNPDFTTNIEIKSAQLAFFAGAPEKDQKNTANNLIEFLKYHDVIMSMSKILEENRE